VSVQEGLSDHQLDLAYLEGGALVRHIEKRWGMKRVWAHTDAVSVTDAAPAGIEEATQGTLGITWRQLSAGWKGYVETLQ
jgi:hypothetical protein